MGMSAEEFFKQKVGFLSGLNDAELRLLAEAAEETSFKPGRSIIMQGMTMDGLFVVEKGKVAVWIKPKSGTATQVATLGPGDVFGERTIVELGVAGATIKALEETFVYLIRQDAFVKLMEDDPSRRQYIIDKIAERRARLASNPEIARPDPSKPQA